MKQQTLLNVFGIPVKLLITYGTTVSRTYHYSYGMIFATITYSYGLDRLVKSLEKAFKKETIEKMDASPFIWGDVAYVFGYPRQIFHEEGEIDDYEHIYVEENGKKISLQKLAENYINERTAYFEEAMHTVHHEVHVKQVSSTLGNNYLKRHIINYCIYLIHFSMELIDSVVVHELAHDFVPNHSEAFYKVVNKYCTSYNEKRNKLIFGIRS